MNIFRKLIERKITAYILKKVLTREHIVQVISKLLDRLEHLSDKTEIDNKVAQHLRDILTITAPPADK